MLKIDLVRLLSMLLSPILPIVVILLFKPTRKEIKCGILAGVFMAVVDYILEVYAGTLGLWHTHGGFQVLNVPLDMVVSFVFFGWGFCLIYSLFKKLRYHALARAIFTVILAGICTSADYTTTKFFGFLTFGVGFTWGHVFLIWNVLLFATFWFYHFCLKEFWREAG